MPCLQNQSIWDDGNARWLFRTIVAAQSSKTSRICDTDGRHASAQRLGMAGVRPHAQAGFIGRPYLDGVPVDLYKCLLLCLKRPLTLKTYKSYPFGHFLVYIVEKFLAEVHQASLVMEGVESDVAAAESSSTQHFQVLSCDGMAKPADSTMFLEIIGDPPSHAVL